MTKKAPLIGLLFCGLLGAQTDGMRCHDDQPPLPIGWEDTPRSAPAGWDPDPCTPGREERIAAGVISARALAHKPPKAARKEFNRGVQAWHKRQSQEAVGHLVAAIRLDPAFVEAQAELGVVYAKTGRPGLALELFQGALRAEPNLALLQSNTAAVLLMLNRPAEAEQAARRATRLDPASIEANYLMGVAMLMQGRITAEAAKCLSFAAVRYPAARALLADLAAHQKQNVTNGIIRPIK